MVQNKGLIFKSPPTDWPESGKHLTVEARDFDLEQELPVGSAILKINYVSLDPYQRGRLRDSKIKSYAPAFELGKPITNRGIATIVKSNNSKYKERDVVIGEGLPFEEYIVVDETKISKDIKPLDNPYNIAPTNFLSALGMPGLTAYASLYEIGKLKAGETIFISAASGAVGQVVGQIAKHEGLKVIGSVGSDEKLKYITEELGFDDGFNYKTENPGDALERLAPQGLDIYFENVGGETLDAAIAAMNKFGRIIACGMISTYNDAPGQTYGVKNLMQVVGKSLTIQGFIVGDEQMGPKYTEQHQKTLQQWIKEGSYKPKESITVGIDNSIDALLGLFKGQNFGKAILEIAKL